MFSPNGLELDYDQGSVHILPSVFPSGFLPVTWVYFTGSQKTGRGSTSSLRVCSHSLITALLIKFKPRFFLLGCTLNARVWLKHANCFAVVEYVRKL